MKNLIDHFQSNELTVSIASDADKDELIALINHAFAYQDEAKGDLRISIDNLTIKMNNSEFYVWKDSTNNVVACCYIEPLSDRVHFGLLCVADHLRGKGIAKDILKSIDEYAINRGNKVVELDYMSLSPWLKRYYESYGFNETGNIEDIGWCDLVRMEKHILPT